MTNQIFTASNGIIVTIDSRGYLIAKGGRDGMTTYATAGAHLGVQALREYFQHERDQELGRWRDPENPDYVVYPVDDGFDKCWVVDERKYPSEYETWTRREVAGGCYPMVFGYATAKRYFDAHPEPKPWQTEPKPGEAWKIMFDGYEVLAIIAGYNDEIFILPDGKGRKFDDPRITAGRRVYPREENK